MTEDVVPKAGEGGQRGRPSGRSVGPDADCRSGRTRSSRRGVLPQRSAVGCRPIPPTGSGGIARPCRWSGVARAGSTSRWSRSRRTPCAESGSVAGAVVGEITRSQVIPIDSNHAMARCQNPTAVMACSSSRIPEYARRFRSSSAECTNRKPPRRVTLHSLS